MSLHLLDLYSPFTSSEVDQALFVSGFASVELVDREGEIVNPLEFDLQTFMNCPQLLLNHKYIRNPDGSDGAIGTVERAVPSFISGSNPSNPKEWVVKSMLDNEVVAFWPKMKSPKLSDGDRGLFVVAKVTHKPTIKRINEGELGGFSWVGYSFQERDMNGARRLKAVDLVEISVVNGPCMSQSTLSITDENDPLLQREINLEDLNIYKMGFSKSTYNLEDVKRYTKALNIQTHVSESDDSYVISVGDESLVNAKESVSIKIDNRFLVAAPRKAKNLHNMGEWQEGQMVYAVHSGVEYVGRIEHIMYEGSLGPGTNFEIPASPENPALLIRVYSQREGSWMETQYMTGVMSSDATLLEDRPQSQESSLVDKGYKKDPEYRKKMTIAQLGKLNPTVIKEKLMENGIQGTEVVEKNVEPVNLYVLDIDSFMSRYPKASVMKQKSAVIDEVPVEIHSIEVPVEEIEVAPEVTNEVVEEVVAEEVVAEVTETVEAEQVAETVADDKYEKLFAAVETLLQRTQETIQKQEDFEQKLAAVKSVDEIRDEVKQEFQKALQVTERIAQENQEQKTKIEKQLAAFNRVVPDQDVRAEKVQSAKSEASTEINIFDYFGVVKERN